MPRPPSYQTAPDIPKHPIEDGRHSWFSVIVPIARTNLVSNPSMETNSAGYTAAGSATVTRVATQQCRGLYSFQVAIAANSDGVFGGSGANPYPVALTLTSGTVYAFSVDVLTVANVPYKIYFADTSGTQIGGATRFIGNGRWMRPVVYYKETSTTTRRIYVIQDASANRAAWYVDGFQVEAVVAGELASTYIDGDQLGLVPNQFPVPYGWNGTPHASTSYRTGQTRAGGYVMPLSKFGFLLLAIIGLGMVPPNVIATDYVQLDGGQFERIQKPSRQFTLAGRFDARSPAHLDRLRGDVEALLDRDLVGQQQPLVLLFQKWLNDRAVTDLARIVAVYQGGLEGQIDNGHAEEASLVFRQFLPTIMDDRESAVALTANASVSNVNRIALRTPAGDWQALGTGASGGSVYAVAKGQDGKYYIGGSFTSFNGVANTARIASYDPTTGTVAALGTGAASGTVWDLQVAPNGEIWAVGTFANMGGVAAADFVAYWDGAAWNAPGTPPTVSATDVLVPAGGAFDTSGNFYLAAATTTISKWTRSTNTWSTIAACTGVALTAVRMPDGNIAFAGTLSVVDGVSGGPVYKYTVATDVFTSLGTPGYAVTSLAYDAAGNLYTGGSITLSRYNGAMWVSLATISGGTAAISKITYNPASFLLYGSGAFTQVGSVTPPDSFIVWDGSAVQYPDIDLPGTAGTTYVTVVKAFADGSVVVGLDASGTATAAASTTVTNTGTVKAYPILTIKGPSSGTARLYNLRNVTTGREIFFNITLNAGETLIINLDPTNLSLVSDFQGDLTGGVLSGSNIADWFLQPGANVVTFLSGSSTITISMRWRNQFASLNQLTL